MKKIVNILVPGLADYCRIAVIGKDTQTFRMVTSHANPDQLPLTKELYENYIRMPEATHGIHRLIETGKPELISIVDDAVLETV